MDEVELIAGLKAGDPAAANELVNLYGDRLVRSAFVLCGNLTEAEDLTQETFIQAMKSAARFEGRSSIYTWLHAILLNLTRRYQRKRGRLIYDDAVAEQEPATVDEAMGATDAATAASALTQAMRKLSEAQREVIVLRFYEDLKLHEMAAQLGVSTGTVKSRLHYAVRELQKLLPETMNLFGDGETKERR
jgi:RNA polymerase sigma-70 factor (ECF subfamily)